MISRRELLAAAPSLPLMMAQSAPRPNVLLILTDDQGYGDFGCHGNPHLKTPHLDRLASQSAQFTQFYSQPVCSPTRACLLTGRYYYRTGVTDTYLGRSMMHADETTLAELFTKAGYQTGIFGKWHLGDHYPLRAIDQGFQEALICTGGGLTQPSDPPGNHYQDPWLMHNGQQKKYTGYCTDIFTNAAIDYMAQHRAQPFFVYLATNAPHTPLEIDEKYVAPYRAQGLNEETAKVYGMLANLDENIGRLLAKLDEWNLSANTLVLFSTDNGPQQRRYNANLRGLKGQVYEGGIRVPMWVRGPGVQTSRRIDRIAAGIDLLPTLTELCGLPASPAKLDGRSLAPLLRSPAEVNWPDRPLFFQWHRGEVPEPFRSAAVRTQRYKLVNGQELYDLNADPQEAKDVSAQQPERVAELRTAYDKWFADVSSPRHFAPPRVYLGAEQEPLVTLTRQDWRGPQASWDDKGLGHWEVDVRRAGGYQITLRFPPSPRPRQVKVRLGNSEQSAAVPAQAANVTIILPQVTNGPSRLEAELSAAAATAALGPHYVEVRRL